MKSSFYINLKSSYYINLKSSIEIIILYYYAMIIKSWIHYVLISIGRK